MRWTTFVIAVWASLAGAQPAEFETFHIVFLMRGDHAQEFTDEELQEIQKQHLAHLDAQIKDGRALTAGPFEVGPEDPMRGIVVYSGQHAREQVIAWAEADPAVQARRLRVEVKTWWTGKGSVSFPMAVPYAQ